MKRKSGLLSVFALALFMMSIFLPITDSTGIPMGIENTDSIDQPSQVASETGLDGRNTPMSMLVYTEFSDTYEFRNTIDSIEETYGYWFNYQNLTDYTELDNRIWEYDVFLIVEQEWIYDENVTDLVAAWSPFISDWVAAGGIIVHMDYYNMVETRDGVTIPLYNETGLMNIVGLDRLTGDTISRVTYGDALARGVEATSFTGPDGSLGYNTTDSVMAFGSGDYGWAVHKVMGLGHVVMIGSDNFERNQYFDIVLANALRLHQHVVIDNSHSPVKNPYTANINFTNDLLSAGFAVTIMDTWAEWMVNSADVLILQWGGTVYTAPEVDFIEGWVSNGGGLFVLSEFGALPNELDPVTDRFGFMRNTTALISDSDDYESYDRYVIYEKSDGNIANHSVSLWTNRVELAGGGAFDAIPDNAVPIIVNDVDGTAGWWNESFIYVGQWNGSVSAAVAPYGMGRVSVVLDTDFINNLGDDNSDGLENYFEYDNDRFAVNNVRWLFAAGIEEKTVLFEESNGPIDYANGWYYDFAIMLTLNGFTVKWESAFHATLINEADIVFIADGSQAYDAPEIAVLNDYVLEGGSLFLLGDTTFLSDNIDAIANEFGIAYNNTAGHIVESDDFDTYNAYLVYNQSNFATHPIMEGVTRMEFDLCTAFESIGTGTALAFADDDGTAIWSNTGTIVDGLALAVATTKGKGRVVAITDVNMPMTNYDPEIDGYGNMLDSDNDVFLANVFIWLTANRAPSVEVIAPNSGEVLNGIITISWDAVDFDSDPLTFDVFYSDNSGSDWHLLADDIAVQEFEWDTSLYDDGSEYLILVEVSDGVLIGSDESDGTFEVDNPDAPTVEVIYPNGGEVLNGVVNITWTAFDLDGDTLSFNVSYSANNGSDWNSLATNCSETWFLWDTTSLDNGSEYLIRVVVNDGGLTSEDVSDGTFTVENIIPMTTTTTTTTTNTTTGTGGGLDTTTIIIIVAGGVVIIIIIIIIMKKKK